MAADCGHLAASTSSWRFLESSSLEQTDIPLRVVGKARLGNPDKKETRLYVSFDIKPSQNAPSGADWFLVKAAHCAS
jgi:hypothetical protein